MERLTYRADAEYSERFTGARRPLYELGMRPARWRPLQLPDRSQIHALVLARAWITAVAAPIMTPICRASWSACCIPRGYGVVSINRWARFDHAAVWLS